MDKSHKRTVEDNWKTFLQAQCPSCHPNNSVKELMETKSSDNNLRISLSGTTRVIRYQKGKTNLDFTDARDNEWQWHQLGHTQVCTSLQTDNHASTPPLSFYRPDALPAAQPTASMHWKQLQVELFSDHKLTTAMLLWTQLVIRPCSKLTRETTP